MYQTKLKLRKHPVVFSNTANSVNYSFRYFLIGLTSLLLSLSFSAKAQWKNPTDNWKTLGPPKGSLLVVGGASVPAIFKHFIEMVGDPEALIVMIPTAGDVLDENNTAYPALVKAGAKNIVILHTNNRDEANTEEFIAPLLKAKAVYIAGGFQKRLAKAYLNTRTHQAMFDVLARGGVVAGSSAGASIQGSFLYGGGEEKVGLGFIKDSAIGQHYVRRNRMGSVAKILNAEPKLLGIGIDEATAIEVKGNEFEVIGDSKVAIYDASLKGWPKPKAQYYLFPGDKFDMRSRKVTHQAQPLANDLWDDANKKWKDPSANWETIGPPEGKLLIYGDKEVSDDMLKHFLKSETTTQPAIVVLSTGNETKRAKNEETVNKLKKLGATNVTFLHSINNNEANSKSFTTALRTATAVWICDSEKWQLADTYLNSLLHKELFDVLKRNGTIAGMGSGAAIMASRLFGDPENYRWNKGYGLVRNTMIFDAPLTNKFLKSMKNVQQKSPNLLGVGITKGAIVEIKKGDIEVSGKGNVMLYKAAEDKPVIIAPGKKQTIND
ncbi:Type 1 glutamine amidotransferase-like domain-containing protein [Pedobacter sp. UBA4863]|uniref:Type 1 glutamine amidotransferase-like domain-containing protein n=1 Tax=Pedobacter sp. UBA4863 TaxID=1947060 RepID=UPI0025F24382|nr:Type 1 glutamine amidotransferase-like domain-containing protein [Pedobacter sp. UBA4863]